MENLFFDSWQALMRAFVATVLAYATLVVMIRISGKRTLSKMNAYDFLVTIALGSCLASTALNKSVALTEGALVYGTLILLQFIITWSSVRISRIKRLVGGSPTLLLYRGEFLRHVMKKERITMEEIYIAARRQGVDDFVSTYAIILEPTGDISIVKNVDTAPPASFADIELPGKFSKA